MATIRQRRAAPSGLSVGSSVIFQQDDDPKDTSRMGKGAIYPRRRVMEYLRQMTWPPRLPDLNLVQMVWDKADPRIMAKGTTFLSTTVPKLQRK